MKFPSAKIRYHERRLGRSPSIVKHPLAGLTKGRQLVPFRFEITSLCQHTIEIKQLYMMTSSNGNIFCVTCPLCGEFTGHGEFPSQRPVTRIFDVFFDLRLNNPLSKQPWGWWFETPSRSLWRHCNVYLQQHVMMITRLVKTERLPS